MQVQLPTNYAATSVNLN